MCDLGQSSDWCYLPDVALIEVYKYLDDSERVAAARVCKNWLRIFETPLLWRYRCVSFGGFDAMGTADRACRYIKRFGKHLRSLAIRFQGPTYRTVKVISQATEVFLKKLAVIANMRLKEFTLYHANMENHWHFVASKNRVVASLCRFLRRCRELEVLNLIAARVTLVDGCRILESLGRGAASKTLKFLYMEDMFQTNVIPISISRYRNAMSKMKGLTYIYTNYNTVNGEILRHFAREQKMKTFTLTIDCDINSWVIEPETWTYFKRQCPDTKVIFYIYASGFRHGIQHALPETVPMKEIDIIAWPAIVESRAEAQTRLCGLIHHISNVYSDTLESFSLHLDKNQPVDDEILYFLGRCYRLKHLSLFCKMSVNTVEKICQMQYDKQLNLRSLNLGVLGLDETELKYLMTVRVQLTQAISQSNNNVVITSEIESDDDDEESMEEESEEEEENEEDVLEDEDEDENVEEENGHVLGNLDGQANEEQPLVAVVNNEDDGNEEGNENNEESNQDEDENGHIIGNLDGQANAEQPREVVNNEDEGNEDEEENENNEENNEIVEAIENEEGDESNVLLVQHDEVEEDNQNDVEVNNENDGEVNNENQDENNLNEGNAILNTENIDCGNVDDADNVEQYNEEGTLAGGQQEIRTIIGHNSLNASGENGEPQHIEGGRTNSEHNYGMRFDQYYENIAVIEDIIGCDTENIGIDEQSNMGEINSYPGETSQNNDRDSSTGHCVGYVEVFHMENSWTRAKEDFHGVDNEVGQYFPWEDIEIDGVQDRGDLNAENNDENGDNIDNEGNNVNSEEVNRESVEINDEHGPSDVELESVNNADGNDIDERGVDEGNCHNDDDEGNNEINVENIGHDDENIDHENDNIDHEDDIHDGIDDSDINDDDAEDDEADETDNLDENDDENEGDDEGDEEDEDSVDDIFAQLMAETDDEEEDEDYDVVLMEDRSEDDESTEYEDEGDDENDDRSINEAETTDEEL